MKIRTWLIWLDAVCVALAILISVVAIIRYTGNIAYPVWILAPWGVLIVLLAIISIVHMFFYVPMIGASEGQSTKIEEPVIGAKEVTSTKDETPASVIVSLFIIGCAIAATVQFFHHAFGYLSVELLIFLLGISIADIFAVIPFVKARTIRDLLPTEASVKSDQEQN